jgi:hypothetical protein
MKGFLKLIGGIGFGMTFMGIGMIIRGGDTVAPGFVGGLIGLGIGIGASLMHGKFEPTKK